MDCGNIYQNILILNIYIYILDENKIIKILSINSLISNELNYYT